MRRLIEVSVVTVVAFACGAAAIHLAAAAPPASHPPSSPALQPPATTPPSPPERPHIVLKTRAGGWTVRELCEAASAATGRPILLDRAPQGSLNWRIESTADVDLPGPKLFAWVQGALYARKLVLVPLAATREFDEGTWQLMSDCDAVMRQSPVVVDEKDVLALGDRAGLLVMTTLRVPDGVDSVRMRNALSPISTQTAGVGRVQDVPDRGIVIVDFAPVVAAMKRTVDTVGGIEPPKPKPRPD